MSGLQEWLLGARHLLFPLLCCGCQRPLLPGEQAVCFLCARHLSRTSAAYHQAPLNDTRLRLLGRFPVERATSFCYFVKDGLIQQVLHQVKYRNRPDLAVALGEWMGEELKAVGFLEGMAGMAPVPLHFRKEIRRGYNQSERLAHGLHRATGLPVFPRLLVRTRHTESQTQKTVAERVANVADAFRVRHPEGHRGRHLLLIDDVLTTGATLEACATALLRQVPDSRVSIATLALANY